MSSSCDLAVTARRSSTGWRPGALLREATANILTTGGGALVLLCVAVLGGAASVVFEAHRANSFHAYVDELRLSGRNTVIFAGTDTGAAVFEIERESCEALVETPGVVRAGLMTAGDAVTTEQFGPFVPVLQVSAGLLPGLQDGLVVAGDAFGTPGQQLTVSVDGVPVATRVGDPQPAATGLNSSIAVALAAGERWAATCLVEIDPYRRSADVIPALAAQLVTHGGQVSAHEPYTGPADVAVRYRSDPARFLPWVVALFGAVLSVIRAWAGTGAAAAYRLSGTTPTAHLAMLATEQVLVAGVFASSASLAVLALAGELLAPMAVLLRAVQASLLWVVVFTLGAFLLPRSNPTALAKDR